MPEIENKAKCGNCEHGTILRHSDIDQPTIKINIVPCRGCGHQYTELEYISLEIQP